MLLGAFLAYCHDRYRDHRNTRRRARTQAAALREIARLPDYLQRDLILDAADKASTNRIDAIRNIRLIDE